MMKRQRSKSRCGGQYPAEHLVTEGSSMRIWPSKRRWKHIGIGVVALFAIALIANGFMAWRTEAHWSGMIAAIRAAGEPGSIAELAPKPISDDQNAAALLAKLG